MLPSRETRSDHTPSVPWRRPAARTQPLFTDAELSQMRSGMHCLMYTKMGAHLDVVNGVAGTRLAVWAPNAKDVSVLCDQNWWEHGRSPLDGLHAARHLLTLTRRTLIRT